MPTKSNNSRRDRKLSSVSPIKRVRRFEGDHLAGFIRLSVQAENAVNAVRQYVMAVGPQYYGMNVQTEIVDEEGYIISVQEAQARQAGGQVSVTPQAPSQSSQAGSGRRKGAEVTQEQAQADEGR